MTPTEFRNTGNISAAELDRIAAVRTARLKKRLEEQDLNPEQHQRAEWVEKFRAEQCSRVRATGAGSGWLGLLLGVAMFAGLVQWLLLLPNRQ